VSYTVAVAAPVVERKEAFREAGVKDPTEYTDRDYVAEFSFEASHRLSLLPETHKCSRLHGHHYVVEVVLESEELDRSTVSSATTASYVRSRIS